MSLTPPDYPENVSGANKGTAQSLAAPSGAGVGGTIPPIYQDFKRDMDVLWEMVMASENSREKLALMSGVSALKIVLLDRGYA